VEFAGVADGGDDMVTYTPRERLARKAYALYAKHNVRHTTWARLPSEAQEFWRTLVGELEKELVKNGGLVLWPEDIQPYRFDQGDDLGAQELEDAHIALATKVSTLLIDRKEKLK
jgi:hypothetical protein